MVETSDVISFIIEQSPNYVLDFSKKKTSEKIGIMVS